MVRLGRLLPNLSAEDATTETGHSLARSFQPGIIFRQPHYRSNALSGHHARRRRQGLQEVDDPATMHDLMWMQIGHWRLSSFEYDDAVCPFGRSVSVKGDVNHVCIRSSTGIGVDVHTAVWQVGMRREWKHGVLDRRI